MAYVPGLPHSAYKETEPQRTDGAKSIQTEAEGQRFKLRRFCSKSPLSAAIYGTSFLILLPPYSGEHRRGVGALQTQLTQAASQEAPNQAAQQRHGKRCFLLTQGRAPGLRKAAAASGPQKASGARRTLLHILAHFKILNFSRNKVLKLFQYLLLLSVLMSK
jgi:hypothetical protein